MSLEEQNNLPSESDSDDEDYVPTGTGNDALSEEESGNESQEECGGGSGEEGGKTVKRKKSSKKSNKSRKKAKPVEEKENEEEKPPEEISFEEKKKRASALWEDFMKDVGTPAPKKTVDVPPENPEANEEKKEEKVAAPQQPTKVKITELFEFAGEKVEVEREVVASPVSTSVPSSRGRGKLAGGISGILGQLGKKGKLSTLEKSKLDWDKFKKEEGIDEDLDTFNKGKNGYLEKQDFLQRADVRQFEIEKEMRNKRRTVNR